MSGLYVPKQYTRPRIIGPAFRSEYDRFYFCITGSLAHDLAAPMQMYRNRVDNLVRARMAMRVGA